jgi:4-hydroxy-3-polyprenylbenzoate decarboxylase
MASRHADRATPHDRVVVGFSATNRLDVGLRLLQSLVDRDVETHVVVSRDALRALGAEDAERARSLAAQWYAPENQAARISSGSFLTRGMIVAPCDGASVAAIVLGLATNLVFRAADVTLKERRPLVLGVAVETLERVPTEVLERAAAVPDLELVPLPATADAAADALLAQLGSEEAVVPA